MKKYYGRIRMFTILYIGKATSTICNTRAKEKIRTIEIMSHLIDQNQYSLNV